MTKFLPRQGASRPQGSHVFVVPQLEVIQSILRRNQTDEVAAVAAEKLYGTINHLEWCAGFRVEDTKSVVKGAVLCPGCAISRAILVYAIAFIRRDRLFTADFTPTQPHRLGFRRLRAVSNRILDSIPRPFDSYFALSPENLPAAVPMSGSHS